MAIALRDMYRVTEHVEVMEIDWVEEVDNDVVLFGIGYRDEIRVWNWHRLREIPYTPLAAEGMIDNMEMYVQLSIRLRHGHWLLLFKFCWNKSLHIRIVSLSISFLFQLMNLLFDVFWKADVLSKHKQIVFDVLYFCVDWLY